MTTFRLRTGYFWREPDVCAFGVFTPSVGTGIYHMADPTGGLDGAHPGIKVCNEYHL